MAEHESEASYSGNPPTKRLKLDEESQSNNSEESRFIKFCDDLILEIFLFLKHPDLLALSQCCQKFHRIVCDRSLWTKVDLRDVKLSEEQLQEYIKFCRPTTTFFATKGPWQDVHHQESEATPECSSSNSHTITVELIESITKNAPNLTTLIFENHILGDSNLTWNKFPNTLEHLSLRTCHFQTSAKDIKSYFSGINFSLPNLKSLDLSNSLWFESHSLLALSKCQSLRELRLVDCPLADLVPYISLSTRFGFRALAVVDLRRTWVSDREVSCLSKTQTLTELYLESPADPAGPMLVTDMAVTAFGATPEHWNQLGFHVIILDDYQPPPLPPSIQALQVSNYRTVTDISLQHCADCLRDLRQLDVRGTAVTRDRVIQFSAARPDVKILSDFQLDVEIPAS